MPVLDVENLLSPAGPVARRLEGFEPRGEQVEMARLVERALEGRGRLMVEAGTGVGKSFAYLVPAIKRIVEHHERVVVVTNTINLQEQLIEKDIPLLSAVIGGEFSAVLVKGRGNYVSLRRLKLASERQERLFGDDQTRHSLHLVEDWAYETTDGSRSTLPPLPRPEMWDYARSDAHNCMGRACPLHERCFYQRARRRMENGDLLVCNHALFFSDLALRAAGVEFLPRYQHVILDEAHAAEEVAADHFGASLSEAQVGHLLRLLYDPGRRRGFLATLAAGTGAPGDAGGGRVERAVELVQRAWDEKESLFGGLALWQHRQQRPGGRTNGRIDEPGVVENTLTPVMHELGTALKALREHTGSEADDFELNSYAQRAAEIAGQAEVLVDQKREGCVYFVEGTAPRAAPGAGRRRRLVLRCVSVDVAPALRAHLFGQEISIVLTSATLTTGRGDFRHLAARLGCDGAETAQLGSPFDHARQMQVRVSGALPRPGDPAYADRLAPCVERLVRETDGGAFVLFTSFAMLEELARRLRPPLSRGGFPLLAQGADGPPGLVLKRFRDNRRSVLLGTMSFWQGVDVRGEGLRNVIITRLPFEVPDRPIVEARHERIAAAGGNPFLEDQLPRAIIRFRQGVGRLIRGHADRGLVAVLDPRIVTRPYGRRFIAALPENVTVSKLEVSPPDPG